MQERTREVKDLFWYSRKGKDWGTSFEKNRKKGKSCGVEKKASTKAITGRNKNYCIGFTSKEMKISRRKFVRRCKWWRHNIWWKIHVIICLRQWKMWINVIYKDFVLVKFPIKSKITYYISRMNEVSAMTTIKFLSRKRNSSTFIFSNVDDISELDTAEIVAHFKIYDSNEYLKNSIVICIQI